jgi:hypothetical protein
MRTIEVPITWLQDEETGELFILDSERDIAERRDRIGMDRKRAQELMASSTKAEQERGKALKSACADNAAFLKQYEEAMPALTVHATKDVWTLEVPSYGEWDMAEGLATVINDATGDVRIDLRILMRTLLPTQVRTLARTVPGASKPEVSEVTADVVNGPKMDPRFAELLWQRLYRALRPDATRLPFLRLPSETGATESCATMLGWSTS